ncbi:MAG: DMT family transporter [Lewinellaceae bacterium]|nr:DMT family transporter [Phaeodactylibacter sp.]MCB9348490.1 DMT family transporter [Lewinellaceae bacterium]
MDKTAKAHIALFMVALIYGANYTIAKEVMGGGYLPPLVFILLRVSSGVLLFWLFHRALVRERVGRADLGRLALCGLFGVALNQMLFFAGLNWTTPINASLIMTTTPVLVLVASAVLLGERITKRKVLGIALGAAGAILLITYGERLSFARQGFWGDLLVFLNACAFGIYLVLVKKLMAKYHPITVVKWAFFFGILFVIPFGGPGLIEVEWARFTPGIWLAVVYVLLCTTFLAYLFNAYALSVVNPSVVSIYIYLQPLLATLIALAFSRDQMTAVKLMAALLIFTGVYLVSGVRWRKGEKGFLG